MVDGRLTRVLVTTVITVSFLAGAAAPANLIDLAIQPADISILGGAFSDNLGKWRLAVGDINGDGVEDVLAVACGSHPLGGARTGTLYIFWGDQLALNSMIDLAMSPPGVSRVFGNPGDDDLACTVASGDFNDDGFDDIVWGQPLTGTGWTGKAYVIFGKPTFPDTLDLYMQPPDVLTVHGNVEGGTFGRTLCACDVDGDGYEDLILTAPWLEYSEVFVLRGRHAFPETLDTGLPEPGLIRIIDDAPNTNLQGITCGDVNSDGFDDLLLGAIDADPERLVLLYGSPVLSVVDSVQLADPPVPIKIVLGEYSHGALGITLDFGDLNGDGELDLVAGAYHADPLGCSDCGEIYILYTADSLPDTVELANTTVPMTRIVGFGTSTKYGARVLCADVSGDSIHDLVLASRPLSGRATVSAILGRPFMPGTVYLATDFGPITRIMEEVEGSNLGHGIAAIDLNFDGTAELMLGAPYASPPGRSFAGKIYGLFTASLVTGIGTTRSQSFTLMNTPNPFSAHTTVTFDPVPKGRIELSVYDVRGRRVFSAIVRNHGGGGVEFVWDGRDDRGTKLPSGIYFCRARAGSVTETRKLVLLR